MKEHRQLATLLLAGRSLSSGPPWDADTDRDLVVRERVAWTALSEDEQGAEQRFLEGLWSGKGMRLASDPSWVTLAPVPEGGWPAYIDVPKSAFGLPRHGFRPHGRSPGPGMPPVASWLFKRGFLVIAAPPGAALVLEIPAHRVVQEADRLAQMLAQKGLVVSTPWNRGDAVTIRAAYDPISGRAVLEVRFPEGYPQNLI